MTHIPFMDLLPLYEQSDRGASFFFIFFGHPQTRHFTHLFPIRGSHAPMDPPLERSAWHNALSLDQDAEFEQAHFRRMAPKILKNMNFSPLTGALLTLVLLTVVPTRAHSDQESGAANSRGLQRAVVLIIRHGEKPDRGSGLSPMGEARTRAYVNYFQKFTVDSKSLRLNYLFSAADSKESRRPRLTLEPLGKALGLKIDSRFRDKHVLELAHEIQNLPPGKNILICWHHGEIPQLLRALGAAPEKLIPNAKWPDDVFGWLIQLHYDENGHLLESKCINENLLPDDAGKHAPTGP